MAFQSEDHHGMVLGGLSRLCGLEVARLAFTTGALDPETLGCRTHLWALKAAGVGLGLEKEVR